MPIVELTASRVRLPLKRRVQHASAERSDSENIVVACRLEDGLVGYGEGVPRSYVTGETAEGAMAQFAATDWPGQLAGHDPSDWPGVIALCDRIAPRVEGTDRNQEDSRGIGGNALKAAVELSLLDAFGQRFGQPVSAIVSHVEEARPIAASRESVRYSAAITAEGAWRERLSALKMRLYGFTHCKVKVGLPGADDALRLQSIRRVLGPRIDLRVDANEGWSADEAVSRIRALSPVGISCVEQPVRHEEVAALQEIRRQVDVPIMLDESLAGPRDAEEAIAGGLCDLFNLRLSKCGGFLACLRLAARAHAAGLGYQLGCHPGESGILSAAGRHWAASVDGICYLEGSYDRHLVKVPLTQQDMTFGWGGRASALGGPGWGVTVDPRQLAHVTSASDTFRW